MKLIVALLAVALLVTPGCKGEDEPVPAGVVEVRQVGSEELHKLVHGDLAPDGEITEIILIDSRARNEFIQRSLPGALNVSYVGCGDESGRFDFLNPVTGKTGAEALTRPDGTPFPKDARLVFYAGRAG